jgi:hypothetical protein
MKLANTMSRYSLLAVAGLMLAACANQMEPAKAALTGIEAAVNTASADAGKYIPNDLAAVQGKVAELKTAFDKKDYASIIAGAPAVLASAQGLVAAAAAKKDEVMKLAAGDWSNLSAAVPGLVAAVTSRVAVLGKSRHLPEGVDLAAAKSALAEATEGWSKAQSASTAGNVEEAASLAKMVKDKATAAATALKMTLPGT